jgi:endonuclease-3
LNNKIDEIIRILEAEFPGMNAEPSKSDPLDVLIATMLSQNTTDKTSYKAFRNLKNDFKSWQNVMNAPLEKIRKAIKVCGLANQKSKNIKKLLKGLQKKYGKLSLEHIKKLKDEEIYDELLQYDGVGVKTISCVLAFALGRDVFPVDTHIHRLSNRLGLVKVNTAEKTFEQMKDKIPDGKKFLLHTLLIRYGRKICRARNPVCSKCPLYELCEFEDKEFYAGLSGSRKAMPEENNFIILEHV